MTNTPQEREAALETIITEALGMLDGADIFMVCSEIALAADLDLARVCAKILADVRLDPFEQCISNVIEMSQSTDFRRGVRLVQRAALADEMIGNLV